MDDERGVILSEERLTDTPGYRAMKLAIQQALPGAIAMSRFPIGKVDVIKHAPIALIRDFYNAYYRPERATMIVVGDVDPKMIQAKILSQFVDWKGAGPAGGDSRPGLSGPRGPDAELAVVPGESPGLALDWATPAMPDTLARERSDLIEKIGFLILGYRLQDLANGPQSVFTQAQVAAQKPIPSVYLRLALLDIRARDWKNAVETATMTVRQLIKYGVSADELARATNDATAGLQAAAARAGTRTSPNVADEIAESIKDGDVFQSPGDRLAFATKVFKTLSAETVNAGLRHLMSAQKPHLFFTSPTPIEGGSAALAAAFAAAEKAPLKAQTVAARVAWPYTNFGIPGRVADRKVISDLQTTFIHFANGVGLTVKPTAFTTGQILVSVKVGNGKLGLPADRVGPEWAFEGGGFIFGGLKAISLEDMQRTLAGRVYNVQTQLANDGLTFTGQTRPADFATQLQVLAAFVSAPGWRAGALDRVRAIETNKLLESGASPEGVFWRDTPSLLRSGDRRWSWPSAADISALTPNGFKTMLEAQLANTPIEVTVVGDVTVDRAVQAVAATFGALPPRPVAAAPSRIAAPIRFSSGTPTAVALYHHGRADQGMATIAWPAVDAFDAQKEECLEVLQSVLATRINDQLRIRDGVTYSPGAMFYGSKVFPGYGYILAYSELSPAKMPLFFEVTSSIAADLRAHPISADELDRARKPALEKIVTDWQTNAYWLYSLTGAEADPRRLDIIRKTIPALIRVTPADVQHAAQTYLLDAKAWKSEITPEQTVHAQ
jgi:zinc protease